MNFFLSGLLKGFIFKRWAMKGSWWTFIRWTACRRKTSAWNRNGWLTVADLPINYFPLSQNKPDHICSYLILLREIHNLLPRWRLIPINPHKSLVTPSLFRSFLHVSYTWGCEAARGWWGDESPVVKSLAAHLFFCELQTHMTLWCRHHWVNTLHCPALQATKEVGHRAEGCVSECLSTKVLEGWVRGVGGSVDSHTQTSSRSL